jgi:diguanylate cyclase (GGDEF)-like protein
MASSAKPLTPREIQGLSHAAQELVKRSRPRTWSTLPDRQRLVETVLAVGAVTAMLALVLVFPPERSIDPLLAGALIAAYAVLARIEYDIGPGHTDPTQLVLVPMLFLLPPAVAPAAAGVAVLLARLPEYVRGREERERALLSLADMWHAIGAAAVFAAAGVTSPEWGEWPVYLAALAVMFALDLGSSLPRTGAVGWNAVKRQLGVLGLVYGVDALLAPVGLMAAFAAANEPYAFLLVLPFGALFQVFGRERDEHIGKALELSRAYRGTARLLGTLLDDADAYTGAHSRDVVSLATAVATQLELDDQQTWEVELTALLHDIGKMTIPPEVLEKPGALTDKEWLLMQTHVIEGQRMLDQVGGPLAAIGRYVRASHERWDGSGYPDGLAGEDVPLAARIVSCCDAYHAMTSDRPYRAAMPASRAIDELRSERGAQFDARVVDALGEVLADPASRPAVTAPAGPPPVAPGPAAGSGEARARPTGRDALTGLPRKPAWRQELNGALVRAEHEGQPLCVVIFDVDRFGSYNGQHGRTGGDALLRASVVAWRSELRVTDQLGRYGSDEFVAFMPGCPLDRAREVAERLSRATAEGQTCCAGVAEWDGRERSDMLLRRAEDALREAKRNGPAALGVAGGEPDRGGVPA